MPQWVYAVQVTVEAGTLDEAGAWVEAELRARLQPDQEGGTWHNEEVAAPRYQIASVRRVAEESATPTYRRGQG